VVVIEVRELRKSYRGQPAVRGLSFAVTPRRATPHPTSSHARDAAPRYAAPHHLAAPGRGERCT